MALGFQFNLNDYAHVDIHLHESTNADTDFVQVASSSDKTQTLLLLGDLHYRDDLLARFPLGPMTAESDADVLLALVDLYGPKVFGELEGEFSIALIDAARGRAILARDCMGRWPLFYATDGQTLRVGTRLQLLAERIGSRPNLHYIAGFLGRSFPCVELDQEQTAMTDIRRVLPGEVIAVWPNGRRQRLAQHDDQCQLDKTVAKLNADEAGRRYHELLSDAIAQRLDGHNVAAHLSGGMDSSTVVCLASKLLGRRDDGEKLTTLSLTYQLRGQAGEDEYMRMISDNDPCIDPIFLRGESALDFDAFAARIPSHDEPYSGAFRIAMEQLLVDAAARRGVRTILTGAAAELTVEPRRFHLADLFRRGRWGQLLKQTRRCAAGGNVGLRQLLWRHAIEPNLPTGLRIGGGRRTAAAATWPHLGANCIAPWISTDFARAYGMPEQMSATMSRIRFPFEQNAWQFERSLMAGDWTCWHLAAQRGMRICHPFLDWRLVKFVRSLKRDCFDVPGVSKPLLQNATKGVLPEPIRTRRYKKNFNDVYWTGLRRNVPVIERILQSCAVRDLDILNVEQLADVVRQHAMGKGDVLAGSHINRSLAVVAWVVALENRQQSDVVSQPLVVADSCNSAPRRRLMVA